LNERNNGDFTIDEVDAICSINDKFQEFFVLSEQSTGFVDELEAENHAWSMMTSHPQSKKYHDIIRKMEDMGTDHFIKNMDDEERKKHEDSLEQTLVFMPETRWLCGVFGFEVECKELRRHGTFPFIKIEKKDIANDFVPKSKSLNP